MPYARKKDSTHQAVMHAQERIGQRDAALVLREAQARIQWLESALADRDATNAALQQAREALRALKKYAQHTQRCSVTFWGGKPSAFKAGGKCDCGLDAALKAGR